MTRRFALCFLLFCLHPALAAPFNGIYVGQSQILDAAPPRQLSLNVGVRAWDAQPGGLEIAYLCGKLEDGQVTESVKLTGVRRGQTVTLATRRLSLSEYAAAIGMDDEHARKFASGEQTPNFSSYANVLTSEGWSGDGRYFLVGYVGRDSGTPDFGCIDVAANPPHLRPLTLTPHDPNAPFGYDGNANSWWSPKGDRVALERYNYENGIRTATQALYDARANRLTSLAIPPDLMLMDWLDNTHLLLRGVANGKERFVSHDVETGKETALTTTPRVAARLDVARPPKGLSLDDEPHQVTDKTGAATMESHALWVRRVNGPKTLSAFPIALTSGSDSPQAGWLPGGKRVAYVAHGDLFVADLIVRPAIPREKLDAGESLSCPEERDLAVGNLKLIGLAIAQYIQDNDENYPPGAGVEKTIDPYIKDPSIFAVGASRFVYKPPANRSLAAMDAPADTVLGTLDLRCATVTLYADGHVRAKVKPGFE